MNRCESCALWREAAWETGGFGICEQRTAARKAEIEPLIRLDSGSLYTRRDFGCTEYVKRA